jgi:hypothetical protein
MSRAVRNALAVAVFVALALVLREALTSEETRVRRALEGGLEAFSEGSVIGCVSRLHGAFEHTTPPRVDRALLAQGLIGYFKRHTDAATGELNAQASMTPDTLVTEVGEDGEARATFELIIETRESADAVWHESWRADVDATLEREALGWVVREVRSSTRNGRPPR